jgi:putative transposase
VTLPPRASESWTDALRKVVQGRRAFPHAASRLTGLSMGLQQVAKPWTQPMPAWKAALNQCVMLCGERVQG